MKNNLYQTESLTLFLSLDSQTSELHDQPWNVFVRPTNISILYIFVPSVVRKHLFSNSAWIVPITQGSFLRTVYFTNIGHHFSLLHTMTAIHVELTFFSFF